MRDRLKRDILLTAAVIVAFGIAVNLIALYRHLALGREFLLSGFSYVMLPLLAVIPLAIYRVVSRAGGVTWRNSVEARTYFVAAIGLAYLAIDEIASVHEAAGDLLRWILRLEPAGWAALLDDAIMVIYGIIALFFIKEFIKEFSRQPYMTGLLVAGFVSFFFMSGFDLLNHNNDVILRYFIPDPDRMFKVLQTLKVLEDGMKIIGECFFISAFAAAYINKRAGLKNVR